MPSETAVGRGCPISRDLRRKLSVKGKTGTIKIEVSKVEAEKQEYRPMYGLTAEEVEEILTAKRYRPTVEGYRKEGYSDERIVEIIVDYS